MKKVKINLPTSWNDVTIKQFHQLRNNFADKSLDNIDLMVSNLCTLSGEDYSVIESLPIEKIKELYVKISFIGTTQVEGEFPNKVILGNKIYNVNPDIRVNYGQFKAIREFCKTEESSNDNLHKIVALFVYEENKPYDEDFEEKCENVLQHCKMNVVFKLTSFFLDLQTEFVKTSQSYSLKKAEQILQTVAKELEAEIQQDQQKKNS